MGNLKDRFNPGIRHLNTYLPILHICDGYLCCLSTLQLLAPYTIQLSACPVLGMIEGRLRELRDRLHPSNGTDVSHYSTSLSFPTIVFLPMPNEIQN